MKKLILLSAALLTACMSSTGSSTTPTVSMAQTSEVKPLQAITPDGVAQSQMDAVAPTNRVPVDFRFTITNPLAEAVTLKGLEMETVGFSGGYSMKRLKHNFEQNIAAGATSTVDVRAWVQPLQESAGGRVTNPVMIHGIARFDIGGKTVRSAFSAKLKQAAD